MIKTSLRAIFVFFFGLALWPDTAGSASTNAGRQSAGAIQTKDLSMQIHEQRSGLWTPELTDAEKMTLFKIAKDTLAWCVGGQKGSFPIKTYALTPRLKINTATFVTLKIRGDLRGCIGSLAPVEPLYLSVHHNAVNAAMHDPRFRSVQGAELPNITLAISILSPIRDIPGLDDFKLGQHGIILVIGAARAVFLPEVATEQGWTKEETLTYLSQKAGLPADAWRRGANFQVFESVVLSLEK